MKALLALGTALLIAIAALPLRDWSELDLQRAPVNRWLWLRSEIVNQPRRVIDYAFTGSSKMQSAVWPRRIEKRLPGSTVYNFAHFAWGHDADYFVARTLLEKHDVGTLVIELPLSPPNAPHSETVHLVGRRELFGEVQAATQELTSANRLPTGADIKERISRISRYTATTLFSFPRHVLERVYAVVVGSTWEYERSLAHWEDNRGFAGLLEDLKSPEGFRERQAKPGWDAPSRPPKYGSPQFIPGPRSELYLERLARLAHRHETRLVFLHVPSWRKRLPNREQHRFYSRFGEVIIPDLANLLEPEYYVDPLHLYNDGARVFTDEVLQLLEEGTQGTFYNDLYRR